MEEPIVERADDGCGWRVIRDRAECLEKVAFFEEEIDAHAFAAFPMLFELCRLAVRDVCACRHDEWGYKNECLWCYAKRCWEALEPYRVARAAREAG